MSIGSSPINKIDKKKLLLLGPYPPPNGGVSIHIKRLSVHLSKFLQIKIVDESKNIKKEIFNIRSYNFLKYLSLIAESDIIHIQSGDYIFRITHYFFARLQNKVVITTVHSYAIENKNRIEKYIDKKIFKGSDKVIFVNEEIYKKFSLPNGYLKDAFLPPILENEDPLPLELNAWIEGKKKNNYIICCANAWRLDLYKDEDLYGLDLCLEAAKYSKGKNLKIAFVFIVGDKNGKLGLSKYKVLLKKLSLEDTFLIFEKSISFINLIMKSDIVLRPTNTDGDALTVREGLFFNKVVIASDIVRRPEKTILFKNRNIESFCNRLHESYTNIITTSKTMENKVVNTSQVEDYVNFYKNQIYEIGN